MNVVLELPADIICDVVERWLYLEDITTLDSAFGHSEQRAAFHKTVLHSPLCLLLDAPHKFEYYNAKAVEWFTAKGIRSEILSLQGCRFGYLCHVGHIVKHARFESMLYEPQKIAELARLAIYHYPNLTSLTLSNCDISEPLNTLLLISTHLTSLYLPHCITRFPLERIPPTHHLHVKSLDMYCDKAIESMVLNKCAPESVQKLHLVHLETQDWSIFTNLRSLRMHVRPNDEQEIIKVFQLCPQIVNLDLSDSTLTDDLLIKISSSLQHLQSLNIETVDGVSDISLIEVAQRHKGSLQALYTKSCKTFTICAGINRVLEECTHLSTLSCSPFSYIDYSLMNKITTLIIDVPYGPDVSRTIAANCPSVVSPYIVYPFVAKCERMDDVIHIARKLPKLRTLFVNDSSGLIAASINIRRPRVLVVDDEQGGDWYYLFNMPI